MRLMPHIFLVGLFLYSENLSLPQEFAPTAERVAPLNGKTIWLEDFEFGAITSDHKLQNSHAHQIQIVTTGEGDAPPIAPGGRHILRFEMKPTDAGPTIRYRAELMTPFKSVLAVNHINRVRWFMYIPKDFDPGEIEGNLIIAQIHGNGSSGPQSTLTLQNSDSGYAWGTMCKHQRKPRNVTLGGVSANPLLEYGEWVQLEVRYRNSAPGQVGICEWYKNGKLLGARRDGKVGGSTSDDPYWKAGLYHRGTHKIVTFIDSIQAVIEDPEGTKKP